ncbi:hypothetical protein GCM10009536_12680 [Streptomyces thermocarboxydus]
MQLRRNRHARRSVQGPYRPSRPHAFPAAGGRMPKATETLSQVIFTTFTGRDNDVRARIPPDWGDARRAHVS